MSTQTPALGAQLARRTHVGCRHGRRALSQRHQRCVAAQRPKVLRVSAAQPALAPTTDAVENADAYEAAFTAYRKLQNGSDVRGVSTEGVPNEPITLSASAAYFIGRGFAQWLAENREQPLEALRVSIGRDPRISGPIVESSLAAGLASQGVRVTRFGLCTTPAMFMSCILPDWAFDAGIMVTASHLPFNRNGAKFCTAAGGLDKAAISSVLARAARDAALMHFLPQPNNSFDIGFAMAACLAVDPTRVEYADFMPAYAAHLRGIIVRGVAHPRHREQPLQGWHIIVNAGNGAGGFFATDVLQPLGANIEGSLNLQPDGTFPAHSPNPEDKAAMAATVEAVLREHASLGVVFDTDVDRSGLVDGDGTVVNKNRYIALMAAVTLRTAPNSTIVTCSTTSNGLSRFIAGLGGRHFRFKKGYKNVISKGQRLNEAGETCELMMETSGHGAMRENYFLDDGAYAAVKIIIECVRRRLEGQGGIGALLAPLAEPVEAAEFRLPITSAEGMVAGERVLDAFRGFVVGGGAPGGWALEAENYEGWRVAVDEGNGKAGWLLLRNSLHDPQLVLNVESEVAGGVPRILEPLRAFFAGIPDAAIIDTSKVEAALAAGGAQ